MSATERARELRTYEAGQPMEDFKSDEIPIIKFWQRLWTREGVPPSPSRLSRNPQLPSKRAS